MVTRVHPSKYHKTHRIPKFEIWVKSRITRHKKAIFHRNKI